MFESIRKKNRVIISHSKISASAYDIGQKKIVPGAKGYLDELTEDRKITEGVLSLLKKQGHTVYNCTDEQGRTAGANLSNIVAKCNAHSAAMDISIHLNAAKKDTGDGRTKGVEVFVYNKNSKAYAAAERVCRKIATLGFTNKGVKTSTGTGIKADNNTGGQIGISGICTDYESGNRIWSDGWKRI